MLHPAQQDPVILPGGDILFYSILNCFVLFVCALFSSICFGLFFVVYLVFTLFLPICFVSSCLFVCLFALVSPIYLV